MSVDIQFHNDVNPKLKSYISHYWTNCGDLGIDKIFKILPMDHIDLIIPIKGDYHVFNEGEFVVKSKVFFSGMLDTPIEVKTSGYVELLGISFKSFGFYPFINKRLSNYKNISTDLDYVNESLSTKIQNIVLNIESVKDKEKVATIIDSIEQILLKYLNTTPKVNEINETLASICASKEVDIQIISKDYNITTRTLERMFDKYIGISPKNFYKIKQFQEASREVLYNIDLNLTDIAYNSNYYDQAHFIRNFQKYTKETPKKVKNSKTILRSCIDNKES